MDTSYEDSLIDEIRKLEKKVEELESQVSEVKDIELPGNGSIQFHDPAAKYRKDSIIHVAPRIGGNGGVYIEAHSLSSGGMFTFHGTNDEMELFAMMILDIVNANRKRGQVGEP